MFRRLSRLLLAVALALGALLAAAPGASAADNGTWSVFPTPSKGSKSAATSDREYFYLEAAPGTALHDKVSVVNLSKKPITFRLYAADAYNTPRDGGFALRTANQKQTGVGAWVVLNATTLTVPARTRADIPFTLTVPVGAAPGDHPGAIVALDTATEATSSSGHASVNIQRAVGARIYLRVSGTTVPALQVQNVKVQHGVVAYDLVNRGNVTLHPSLAVKATGWLGGTVLNLPKKDLGIDVLPGATVHLSVPWAHPPQADHVTVTLTVTAPGVSAQGRTAFTAIPWLWVGVGLMVVAALLAWWYVSSKRRRPHRMPWSRKRELVAA